VGCELGGSGPSSSDTPPDQSQSKVVCDQFQPEAAKHGQGLVGDLYYLSSDDSDLRSPASKPSSEDAFGVINNGHHLDGIAFFFKRLNIWPRPFDVGFTTSTGELVADQHGVPIKDRFVLDISSNLVLTSSDQPGAYQIAVLAKNGTVFQINDDGSGLRTLIQYSKNEATRLECASRTISMSHDQALPVRVLYPQGTDDEVALTVFWRPLSSGADLSDPMCGRNSHDLFFYDKRDVSDPKKEFYEFLSRGWRPLVPGNYRQPGVAPAPSPTPAPVASPTPTPAPVATPTPTPDPSPTPTPVASPTPTPTPDPSPTPVVDPSPTPTPAPAPAPSPTPVPVCTTCTAPDPLVVSLAQASSIAQTTAVITWTTNLSASSQVEYTLVLTGAITDTPVDPTLVTSHSVTLTGLSAGTAYSFIVISVSADGQTAKSDPVTFKTLR